MTKAYLVKHCFLLQKPGFPRWCQKCRASDNDDDAYQEWNDFMITKSMWNWQQQNYRGKWPFIWKGFYVKSKEEHLGVNYCSFHLSLSTAFWRLLWISYFYLFPAETFMVCVNVFYTTRNKLSAGSDKTQRNSP